MNRKPLNPLPALRDWCERENIQPVPAPPRPVYRMINAPPTSELKERTPLTEWDMRAVAAIDPGRVVYCVGCYDKRFARNIQVLKTLTDAQRGLLWKLVHNYRRQIGNTELVAEAKRRNHDPLRIDPED